MNVVSDSAGGGGADVGFDGDFEGGGDLEVEVGYGADGLEGGVGVGEGGGEGDRGDGVGRGDAEVGGGVEGVRAWVEGRVPVSMYLFVMMKVGVMLRELTETSKARAIIIIT